MNMNIGNKIKELRKDRGVTQEQLANSIGVSFQAVSKWETGLCAPDILLLPDLADIFNCKIDELFSRDGQAGEPVLPWEDDGIVRGVVFIGRKLLSSEETAGRFTLHVADLPYDCNNKKEINISGECNVTVEGDVYGECNANGSMSISGDVSGSCNSNGSITVEGDVGGGCAANGSIQIEGDVMGHCESNGNITVEGDIMGACIAGGGINRG